MSAIAALARGIDRFSEFLGRWLCWLALAMVLIQFVVVVMRYVFGYGSIFVQELIVYCHGFMFLIASGYTLKHDGHVRVDIFYREASPRTKAVVDIFGTSVFLIPVCILILVVSTPYVLASWRIFEQSQEATGVPAVYLLKTSILLFCFVMMLQGTALICHSVLRLANREAKAEDEFKGGL